MPAKESIFIYGASGHAKVVIDIIEKQQLFEILCLIDDNECLTGHEVYGYPILGGRQVLMKSGMPRRGIVAVGNNVARATIAAWLRVNSFELVSAVHPAAQLARGVTVGDGTVIMAGAIVNSDAHIGNIVIINTGASVDHDCVISNGSHIAPGAVLCGTVTVGEESFIGAGAQLIPNITVSERVVVGAGSTVLSDVPAGVTVVGSPARIVEGLT